MNRNAKDTIKAALSIESVVGSYLKLEKAGKYFKARCPFHNEKSASFTVTPEKEIFYCYGCHKGGDIFTFVQEIEGISFKEALMRLAEKAGISLERDVSGQQESTAVLRKIMEDTTRFFEIGLRTNVSGVNYLLSRGVTKETMVAFRVGLAPLGWTGLYDFLKRKKYSDQDILACGLCVQGKESSSGTRMFDRFRGRIMFPITDHQGRVIAFTGRSLPGAESPDYPQAKYINSPETILFHKSSVLFGFDKAKSAIHSEDNIILVEGQMDCIMSHQAGITNVVAISGTAATDEHMSLIKRFTDNIVLCLDADKAGLAAVFKTAMRAYQHDMNVAIIDIGSHKDPADVIKENPDQWKDIVNHRKDIISFRLDRMRSNNEMNQKKEIAEQELFPLINHITSEIFLDEKLQEIAHAFHLSGVDPIRKDFDRYRNNHTLSPDQQNTHKISLSSEHTIPLETQIAILAQMLGEPFSSNKIDSLSEDQQNLFIMNLEQVLGSFDQSREAFVHFKQHLELRYELSQVIRSLQQLKNKRAYDPHSDKLLKETHELTRRKDELINRLNN